MTNDLNQCNFIGRLGADVDTRYMPNGNAVANFNIAVGWKGKDKEGTEWVSVAVFGKLAEICTQYLHKGSKVFISGKMRTRSWDDQNGQKKYRTEIVADQMQMLDSRGGSSAPSHQQGSSSAPMPDDGFDDDIPF